MSLFDKSAAKSILLKQVEKHKAKLSTHTPRPAAAPGWNHAPPTSSSYVPHTHPPPPPQPFQSAPASHSGHTKSGWQHSVTQKLNDPAVKAKVEKAAKKKAAKSLIKGVGGVLFSAFEE